MNRLFLLTTCLVLVGLISSCKKDEPEGENFNVWSYHRLVYDAESNTTYARTTFRYGSINGATIELVPQASITFNGAELTWINSTSTYEKQYDGLLDSGTFTYTDSDGNLYSNSISVPSSIGFPPELDSLSVNEDYELNWTGGALEINERVEIVLSAENSSGVEQEFTAQGVGVFGLVLTESKLDNLGVGTTDMSMSKVYLPLDYNVPPAGGLLESRYQSNPKLDVVVTQ